jgi:hypothetical protein
MRIASIAVLSMLPIASAEFDFGRSCSGSGIVYTGVSLRDEAIRVGEVAVGLRGFKVVVESADDVDIQMTSGSTDIINWQYGLLKEPSEQTITWQNDTIRYSGYNGDGTGRLGNEYLTIYGETSNDYTVFVFAHESSPAKVFYSWDGRAGCDPKTGSPGGLLSSVSDADLTPTGVTIPIHPRWRQYLGLM